MRKTITIICIFIVCIGFFVQPIVLNAVFGFVFAGIVPGTSISLPFWAMSCVLAAIGYSATKWLQRDMLFIGDEVHMEKQRKQHARAYVMQKATTRTSTKKPVTVRQRLRRRQQTATS